MDYSGGQSLSLCYIAAAYKTPNDTQSLSTSRTAACGTQTASQRSSQTAAEPSTSWKLSCLVFALEPQHQADSCRIKVARASACRTVCYLAVRALRHPTMKTGARPLPRIRRPDLRAAKSPRWAVVPFRGSAATSCLSLEPVGNPKWSSLLDHHVHCKQQNIRTEELRKIFGRSSIGP